MISGTIDEWPVDHRLVGERMDERFRITFPLSVRDPFEQAIAGQEHGVRAELAHSVDLERGRGIDHHHPHGTRSSRATYAHASAALPALTVSSPRATRSLVQNVRGGEEAANLETSRGLQRFELEEPAAGVGIKGVWRMCGASSRATSCTRAASTPWIAVTARLPCPLAAATAAS